MNNENTDNNKENGFNNKTKMLPNDIFPFPKYYPGQKESIKKIYENILKQFNSILGSWTGSGKTITALCAAIPHELNGGLLKIIMVARTYEQNGRVMEESGKIVKKIREVTGNSFRVLQLKSKSILCLSNLLSENEKKDPEVHKNLCASLRETNLPREDRCPYYNAIAKWNLDVKTGVISEYDTPPFIENFITNTPNGIYDDDRLTEYGKQETICPYYLAKTLLNYVDLVACNYNWVLHPIIQTQIFRGTSFDLSRSICIFDEAHNLINVCQDIWSRSISEETISKIRSGFQDSIDYLETIRPLTQTRDLTPYTKDYPEFFTIVFETVKYLQNLMQEGIEFADSFNRAIGVFIKNQLATILKRPDTDYEKHQYLTGKEIFFRIQLEEAKKIIAKSVSQQQYNPLIVQNRLNSLSQIYIGIAEALKNAITQRVSDLGVWRSAYSQILVKFKGKTDGNEKDIRNPVDTVSNFFNHFHTYMINYNQNKESIPIFSETFCMFLIVQKGESEVKNNYYLKIQCFDARFAMLPILNNAFASLSMTGSFIPSMPALLGYDLSKKQHETYFPKDNPIRGENVQVIIDTTCTSENRLEQERDTSFYKNYAQEIEKYIPHIPGNIGIFCTSYEFRDHLAREIGDKFGGKDVFYETQDKKNRKTIIEEFKKRARPKGAILLGVCQGKSAEGGDFPGHTMNAVIIVGYPLPAQTEVVRAAGRFYRKVLSQKLLWDLEGEGHAILKTTQAGGRPNRNPRDLGLIILMDPRFERKTCIDKCPAHWKKNAILKYYHGIDFEITIVPKINEFFQKFVHQAEDLNNDIISCTENKTQVDLKREFIAYYEEYLEDVPMLNNSTESIILNDYYKIYLKELRE